MSPPTERTGPRQDAGSTTITASVQHRPARRCSEQCFIDHLIRDHRPRTLGELFWLLAEWRGAS